MPIAGRRATPATNVLHVDLTALLNKCSTTLYTRHQTEQVCLYSCLFLHTPPRAPARQLRAAWIQWLHILQGPHAARLDLAGCARVLGRSVWAWNRCDEKECRQVIGETG